MVPPPIVQDNRWAPVDRPDPAAALRCRHGARGLPRPAFASASSQRNWPDAAWWRADRDAVAEQALARPDDQRGRLDAKLVKQARLQQRPDEGGAAGDVQVSAGLRHGRPSVAAPRPRGATPAAQRPSPPHSVTAAQVTAAPGRTAGRTVEEPHADHRGPASPSASSQLRHPRPTFWHAPGRVDRQPVLRPGQASGGVPGTGTDRSAGRHPRRLQMVVMGSEPRSARERSRLEAGSTACHRDDGRG
jgi:hypothetical protein